MRRKKKCKRSGVYRWAFKISLWQGVCANIGGDCGDGDGDGGGRWTGERHKFYNNALIVTIKQSNEKM